MQCKLDAKFSETPTRRRVLRQDLPGLGRSAEASRGRSMRGLLTTTARGGGELSPAAAAAALARAGSPSARRFAPRGPPSSFGGLPILSPMARLAPGWSQAVSEQPGVKIGYIRLYESSRDLLLSCDSASILLRQVPLIPLLPPVRPLRLRGQSHVRSAGDCLHCHQWLVQRLD